MTSLSEYIALEVDGKAISLKEVLRFTKWPTLAAFLQEAADAALIRRAAVEHGIEASDEEFQQAADGFRAERDLYTPETTEEWLAANYLSYAEWEALLENEIIKRKLRDALTDDSVEKYFAEQSLSYDAAAISRLVVKEEDVARELRAQIVEEGADFHMLARMHSTDFSTRLAGGYLGLKRRSDMEAEMEAAVFGAQEGKTVGPIKTCDGWELVKVENFHRATLDDAMRESIKSILFDNWLIEQRLKAKIVMTLLEDEAEEAERDED